MRLKRALGIAITALLLVAANADTASAASFHSEVEDTFLLGEQSSEFVVTTETVAFKCKIFHLEGTVKGVAGEGSPVTYAAERITVDPAYSECKIFGGNITVTTSGCHYVFTPSSASTASFEIECESGKKIVFTVQGNNCSFEFGAQKPSSDVIVSAGGKGTTRDASMTIGVEKLTYNVTGPGMICGSTGAHSGAKFSGGFTLKGYRNAIHTEQAGIWIE